MACVGGCIGGAGCLTHEAKDKNEIDKYGKEALEKSIGDAMSQLKRSGFGNAGKIPCVPFFV